MSIYQIVSACLCLSLPSLCVFNIYVCECQSIFAILSSLYSASHCTRFHFSKQSISSSFFILSVPPTGSPLSMRWHLASINQRWATLERSFQSENVRWLQINLGTDFIIVHLHQVCSCACDQLIFVIQFHPSPEFMCTCIFELIFISCLHRFLRDCANHLTKYLAEPSLSK